MISYLCDLCDLCGIIAHRRHDTRRCHVVMSSAYFATEVTEITETQLQFQALCVYVACYLEST